MLYFSKTRIFSITLITLFFIFLTSTNFLNKVSFFDKNIKTVIHLASVANDPASNLDPKLTWEISCLGTMRLCELSKKNNVKKFIFASSGSVYGIKKEKKVHENLKLLPIISKSSSCDLN